MARMACHWPHGARYIDVFMYVCILYQTAPDTLLGLHTHFRRAGLPQADKPSTHACRRTAAQSWLHVSRVVA